MTPRQIVHNCLRVAEARHGVTASEMLAYDRRGHVVAARHEAMRLAHRAGVPLAEIGRQMDRNHTTVMHAVRKATQ